MDMESDRGWWQIYYKDDSTAKYLPFDKPIFSSEGGRMMEPYGQGYDILSYSKPYFDSSDAVASNRHLVTRYRFKPPHIEITDKVYTRDEYEDFAESNKALMEEKKIIENNSPPEAILLSDYIADPTAEWTQLIANVTGKGLESNYVCSQFHIFQFIHDRDNPMPRDYFTPEYALKKLQEIAGPDAKENTTGSEADSNLISPKRSNPGQSAAGSPTTPAFSVALWFGLIITAFAGIWFLLSTKKK